MKVTTKLTCTLMLAIVTVVTIQAIRSVSRVTALSFNETRDDLYVRASAVGTAVDSILRTVGRSDAVDYVESENARDAAVVIRLLEADPARPATPADAFAGLSGDARRKNVTTTDRELVARVEVGHGDGRAVVECRQSLEPHQRYVREVIWEQVVFTLVLLVLCAGVLLALGIAFIGRPVRLLVEQARTIAGGDFSRRADVRQRDEIGTLAREMNRMCERLAEAQEETRSEHHARTAALEQLRHADRLSSVGKIASGIAHELGTPLNVVSGRATLIARTERCPESIVADARIIAEQAESMAQIIRQLLDFSRNRATERHTVRVGELLEHARSLLEPLADEQNVTIGIAGSGAAAEVDERTALQVLTNLMVNGIQAMPDGGRLELSWTSESVAEPPDSHAAPGEYVCITVEDTGVGIESDAIDHVFEPFFTTKGEGEGTGLGLSVCHGIVKEYGGWITVASEPGRGSAFSVHLPCEAGAP